MERKTATKCLEKIPHYRKKAILNKTKMKFSEQTPKLFWTKTTVCCQVVLHRVGMLRSSTLCQTETSKDGLNLRQVKGIQEPRPARISCHYFPGNSLDFLMTGWSWTEKTIHGVTIKVLSIPNHCEGSQIGRISLGSSSYRAIQNQRQSGPKTAPVLSEMTHHISIF